MLIQVFILAVYAMSYDLMLGYTGILSFGHAMFFGVGAYATGILLKHAGWSLGPTALLVIGVAIVLALLIGVVSLRVRGVYFAMATLAFSGMFFILVQATDFRDITGAEDGLHGIPVPAWLNPTDERLTFYFLALAFCVVMYLIARRVVDSPPGRVMVAIRENEARAQMIGFNTFVYKLLAVTLAGVMAALAGLMNALWNSNATPDVFSVETTINALLMTIIGGVGTLVGPDVGGGRSATIGLLAERRLRTALAAHHRRGLHPVGAVPALRHRRHLADAAERHPRRLAAASAAAAGGTGGQPQPQKVGLRKGVLGGFAAQHPLLDSPPS